jgi:hypothetical protein
VISLLILAFLSAFSVYMALSQWDRPGYRYAALMWATCAVVTGMAVLMTLVVPPYLNKN